MSKLSNDNLALYIRCTWPSIKAPKIKTLGKLCSITSQLENYYSLPTEHCKHLIKENKDQTVINVMREFEKWKLAERKANQDRLIHQSHFTRIDNSNTIEKINSNKSSVIYGQLHEGGIAPIDRYAQYKENW